MFVSPTQVVQSKVVDGGLTDSNRTTTSKGNNRYKTSPCRDNPSDTDVISPLVRPLCVDYNKIIKKNQKRREEFFKQTGKIPV